MLTAFARAFKTPDLRKKILFTLASSSCSGSGNMSRSRAWTIGT